MGYNTLNSIYHILLGMTLFFGFLSLAAWIIEQFMTRKIEEEVGEAKEISHLAPEEKLRQMRGPQFFYIGRLFFLIAWLSIMSAVLLQIIYSLK